MNPCGSGQGPVEVPGIAYNELTNSTKGGRLTSWATTGFSRRKLHLSRNPGDESQWRKKGPGRPEKRWGRESEKPPNPQNTKKFCSSERRQYCGSLLWDTEVASLIIIGGGGEYFCCWSPLAGYLRCWPPPKVKSPSKCQVSPSISVLL